MQFVHKEMPPVEITNTSRKDLFVYLFVFFSSNFQKQERKKLYNLNLLIFIVGIAREQKIISVICYRQVIF